MINKNLGLYSADEWITLTRAVKQGQKEELMKRLMNRYLDCVSFLKSKYNSDEDTARESVLDAMTYFRRIILNKSEQDMPQFGNLNAYVLRICVTKFVERMRKEGRIPLTPINPNDGMELEYSAYDSDMEQELQMLRQAKNMLQPDYQYLLQERCDKEPPTKWKQIALALGASEDAVKHRFETAMKHLKANFAKLYTRETGLAITLK